MAKLQLVRVKLIEDTTDVATFEAAVNAFLATVTDNEFISISYQMLYDGTSVYRSALITYFKGT